MNARHRHARTVVHAWMALDHTPAFVPVASQERTVRRTLITAHPTPVHMGAHAQMETTHLHVRADLDMLVINARWTLMNVCLIRVRTVGCVWMKWEDIAASAWQGTLVSIAKLTLTSAALTLAEMEATAHKG